MDKDIRDALAGSPDALLRYLDRAWASYQKRKSKTKTPSKTKKPRSSEAKPESPA